MKKATIAAVVTVAVTSSTAMAMPWCGLYARKHLVNRDPGPMYNLACKWLGWGRPTVQQVGAIVVWCSRGHHHVGKITGPCHGFSCVVTSGNDGNAVRTRLRSVAGAAFRIGG